MKANLNPNLETCKTEASNLNIEPKELLSIPRFSADLSYHISEVLKSDGRKILTKDGVPLVGIVPLWMIAALEEKIAVSCDEFFIQFAPNMDEKK